MKIGFGTLSPIPPPPPVRSGGISHRQPTVSQGEAVEPWKRSEVNLSTLVGVRKQDTAHDNFVSSGARQRQQPRLLFTPSHAFAVMLILTVALCASLTLFIQQARNLSDSEQQYSSITNTRKVPRSQIPSQPAREQVHEQAQEVQSPSTAPIEPQVPTQKRVNINTADRNELETVKGSGPVMAQRIIDYRKQIGGFTSIDQLLQVDGIGAKTLDKIRSSLVVQ